MTNDFNEIKDSPGKRDSSTNPQIKIGRLSFTTNRRDSVPFGQTSLQTFANKKPSIDKVAREMMVEGRDKGII